MTTDHDEIEDRVADELRAWARGLPPSRRRSSSSPPRAADGSWLARGRARTTGGQLWFDVEVAAAEKGFLSGGERRVLVIAMSLASADHPVDLSDAVCGIDGDALDAVLEAIALASGRDHP